METAALQSLECLLEGLGFALANSLHCAGMCGPMASLFPGRSGIISYQAARVFSYGGVGIVAGVLGASLGTAEIPGNGAATAFVLATFLLLFALGLERHLGRIPGAHKVLGFTLKRSRNLPPRSRAVAVGAITPFIPCGLLYAAYSSALVSGSWHAGGLSMFGFALGSVPLLAFAQFNIGWLQRKLGPKGLLIVSRLAMLAAAAILAWRGYVSMQGENCCH